MLHHIADDVDAVAAIVTYLTPDGVVAVRGTGITRHNCAAFAHAMRESASNVESVRENERRLPPGVTVEG